METLKGKKWPKQGRVSNGIFNSVIKRLKDVAHCDWPIFGFPQGHPTKIALKVYEMVLAFQVNSIVGTSKNSLTSRGVNVLEMEAVSATIDLLGGSFGDFNGLMTTGGTAANRFALQMGREYLNSLSMGEDERIAVICSTMSHYSIFQICQTLALDKNEWLQCDNSVKKCRDENTGLIKHNFLQRQDGSGIRLLGVDNFGMILLKQMEEEIRKSYLLGVKRFIVVANAGTTLTGAVDDVKGISLLLGKLEKEFVGDISFYFHVDAAYGGLVLPFMKNSPLRYLINLNEHYSVLKKGGKEVDSVTVDPHKRYSLYPCGMSIFKFGLEDKLVMQVPYLNGHSMFGPDGTRQGAAVAAYWANIFYLGYKGYKEKIAKCFENVDYFCSLLKKVPGIKMHFSQLGIICVSFEYNLNISDKFKRKYYPCSSLFPKNPSDSNSCMFPIYKFVVMDHWKNKDMDQFVIDLIKQLEN